MYPGRHESTQPSPSAAAPARTRLIARPGSQISRSHHPILIAPLKRRMHHSPPKSIRQCAFL
ncbi:hypothetical protein BD414DRAFT_486822 [Trametes punicea]|nr:hypothetical protein BD414DRAFT_486822 [Trametes punicea]